MAMRSWAGGVLRRTLFMVSAASLCLAELGCKGDDPPGPTGGIILVLRSAPAAKDPELKAISRVEIHTRQIVMVISEAAAPAERKVTVATHDMPIELLNEADDRLVGQFQLPVGLVHQIRIFPLSVTIHLKNGGRIALEVPSSNIPSWDQSGWKIEPVDEIPWPVKENELTGVRGLFTFDEVMLHNKGVGYKFKPTLAAEGFTVNPPADGPGVFADEITVVFKQGTSRARVDALSAELGAWVVSAPILSTAYRLKLSPFITVRDAYSFFRTKSEAQGILPAINYAPNALTPNEGIQTNHTTANLPNAWETIKAALGSVGSRRVRVAVIDNGVDISHPDLYQNIAISQGELPLLLFDTNPKDGTISKLEFDAVDIDLDGVISFVDLNDLKNAAIAPAKRFFKPYVDGADMLADPRWENGIDEDGNGLVDDLVGWDFNLNKNDPTPDFSTDSHGTRVAGLVGAVGDNMIGIAGTNWAVSIVPIKATRISRELKVQGAMMDKVFFDVLTYVEDPKNKISIANTSLGWAVASVKADFRCIENEKCGPASALEPCRSFETTVDLPKAEFDMGLIDAANAYRGAPFFDATGNLKNRVLYVFSAGNSEKNLADPNVVQLPGQMIQKVLGSNRVLIVGAAESSIKNARFSAYGAPVVNVWAPSPGWTSTIPSTGNGTNSPTGPFGGTSAAAPVVAGVAALVLARSPELVGQPAQLAARLTTRAATSVRVVAGGCPGDAERVIQPLVDANASVQP